MSDSLFNIKSIMSSGEGFKVIASAPELAHYSTTDKSYSDDLEVYVPKASSKVGVITSFKELINSIIAAPSANFILGADLSADEIVLPSNAKSYIESSFTGTLTGEVDGKVYNLLNLKAPLFNVINGGKVEKLNLVDVDIKTNDTKVGL